MTMRASISGAVFDHDVLDQQPQETIDCCHSSKQANKVMQTSRAEEMVNQEHSAGDGEPKHYKEVGLESNKKEVGPNIDRKVIEIHRDEEFDLPRSGGETMPHTSRQEAEEHDDKQLVSKLCKICSTEKKDYDHLIECSNENCLYKFYHLRCLSPPLASVPPPTWSCPSCLCRNCFIYENDENIILCDSCDNGYHTYCLNPPLAGVPESNWYCPSCLEKQKRRKRKKGQNHAASASKLAEQVHSKKVSQAENQLSLHMEKACDRSGRLMGSAGPVQLKKAAQVVSPSSLHLGGEPPNDSDKSIKHEMESSVPLMQSEKPSQSSCPEEEDETKGGHSDGSLEGTTDNFIVRVKPKHATKYGESVESKEAGKRKRKRSEPRRSQV